MPLWLMTLLWRTPHMIEQLAEHSLGNMWIPHPVTFTCRNVSRFSPEVSVVVVVVVVRF
jgi:hypothetical protein